MEAFEQLIEQIAPNLYAYRDRFFTSFAATFEMFGKAGLIAFVVGLFFGVLLVVTRKGGVRENLLVYQVVNIVINVFRSIPFIILLIFLIPLTRAVVGSAIGVKGAILPLVFGTVPFYTRQVEVALAGVNEGKVEAARSMGSGTLLVILSVMNLIDRFLIDGYWVGHTNAWTIPGTEDLKPYITAKDKAKKWLFGTVGMAVIAMVLAAMMTVQ